MKEQTKSFTCPSCSGELFGEVVSRGFEETPHFTTIMYEQIEGQCSSCDFRGTFKSTS